MDDTQMITMLKVDLGISTTVYDERLGQYLDSAKAEITREGYTFPETLTAADMQMIVRYAAWRWGQRKDALGNPGAMPRDIRWTLNNTIFSQKAGEVE
jgi:hypothetical protein